MFLVGRFYSMKVGTNVAKDFQAKIVNSYVGQQVKKIHAKIYLVALQNATKNYYLLTTTYSTPMTTCLHLFCWQPFMYLIFFGSANGGFVGVKCFSGVYFVGFYG